MIVVTCPLHGTWNFIAVSNAERFNGEHAGCKWPASTRRFPPKSRKRPAL